MNRSYRNANRYTAGIAAVLGLGLMSVLTLPSLGSNSNEASGLGPMLQQVEQGAETPVAMRGFARVQVQAPLS